MVLLADLELDGMDEAIKKIECLGKIGEQIENKALRKGGNVIIQEAKNNVKERTGRLKRGLKLSGIRKKGSTKYILIGIQRGDNSKIFYGKFKEFGTSKMAATPFLGPAYEAKKGEAMEIIKQELRSALNL